ncbi:Probable mannose-6-phosphate isomerase gmuF [uncultured Eubacterium sp.]|nr:Probable mannose-6-phosphate isomerase gmuF [uncultured Eubacterium sp.]
MVIESYIGIDNEEILENLIKPLKPKKIIFSDDLAFDEKKIIEMTDRDLIPEDRVFGILTHYEVKDFFDPKVLEDTRKEVENADGLIVIYGTGASLITTGDILIYADLARWEAQLRYRAGATNWKINNPDELLGAKVHSRFGKEFPIRFDYLDTMNGGNLSLQVHPLTEYIQEKFGMHYTQDESYYILDAKEGASVYLGVKENTDLNKMVTDLKKAQDGDYIFPDEKYVNKFPAKKHDHFLIPAGTVHCGGSNVVVLEISATPYIFTFKLWDWGRIGLDGKPRPVHIDHGKPNIQTSRTTKWVKENLVNNVQEIKETKDHKEERTGLHELEFIETRRHWFDSQITLQTKGSVNMLNLVEGEEAIVESIDGSFEPYEIHYGETFIIPAQIKEYKIIPKTNNDQKLAIMQAYVR